MIDPISREAPAPFRLMVENSHDILTIRDSDGRIRYANPSCQRILGYPPEELVGTTGLELVHPDDRASAAAAMADFWQKPGARGTLQYRARHANGTWVSLEVVAYNLLDNPDIRGVLINGRDISHVPRCQGDVAEGAAPPDAANAKTLAGVLNTCACCKKIRTETGNWQQIEVYIREHAPVDFSHGLCPECARLWYPEQFQSSAKVE